MVKKYEFGKVGTTRHPQTYRDEIINKPVFTTVEEELAMWKAAEGIKKILDKGKFTNEQMAFIFHYVHHLKGLDNLQELSLFEFMRFRLFYSRMKEMDERKKKE